MLAARRLTRAQVGLVDGEALPGQRRVLLVDAGVDHADARRKDAGPTGPADHLMRIAALLVAEEFVRGIEVIFVRQGAGQQARQLRPAVFDGLPSRHPKPVDRTAKCGARRLAAHGKTRLDCGANDPARPEDKDDFRQWWWRNGLRSPTARLDSWLLRIMRNAWIDQHPAAPPMVAIGEAEAAGGLMGEDGRRTTEARLDLGRVRMAMDRLPQEQREVLMLVCGEGLKYRETAAALDIPLGKVMSRLARADSLGRRPERGIQRRAQKRETRNDRA
ncbi:sigma factor-like helix-turn-helix DNA-binding protein [Roseovarius sp. S1116L3]|uniref:sigma factor-like helix-turn-helix DNA-binding protein n=1 Tax=Roseovarius roseus TaxID=3342636 RepID=UPI003B681015